MINRIGYNYNQSQLSFTSERLAEIILKENGTPVQAYFTKLSTDENKIAIKTLKNRWTDDTSQPILKFIQSGKDFYAIELKKGKSLADKIVALAGTEIHKNNRNGSLPFIMLEGFLTAPEYRYENKERKIKDCGKIMIAMFSKLANKLGVEAIVTSPTDKSLPFYEDVIKMKESDKEYDCLELGGKEKDRFIKEVEAEYKLGNIDIGKL